MLHWEGLLNSRTSSDVMGYLQGVQMKLAMWVNSRNEADDFVKIASGCSNESHQCLMLILVYINDVTIVMLPW